MVDFLNNPIAEFNELRIATTNLVTTKAAEYSETVTTFASNHSSELLYGSLGVFAAITFAYLLGKLFEVSCERDMFKRLYSKELYEHELWYDVFEGQCKVTEALEADVEKLHDELQTMNESLVKANYTISDLEEERDDLLSDRDLHESNAEYWEEQCIDVRNERDELESERDNIEAERDVLLDRIALLQEMTNTYKELVTEIETPQLRLAA